MRLWLVQEKETAGEGDEHKGKENGEREDQALGPRRRVEGHLGNALRFGIIARVLRTHIVAVQVLRQTSALHRTYKGRVPVPVHASLAVRIVHEVDDDAAPGGKEELARTGPADIRTWAWEGIGKEGVESS